MAHSIRLQYFGMKSSSLTVKDNYFYIFIEDIFLCLMSHRLNKPVISCRQTQQYTWLFLF